MFCKNCGHTNTQGTKFCGKCGRPLDFIPLSVASPQQQTTETTGMQPLPGRGKDEWQRLQNRVNSLASRYVPRLPFYARLAPFLELDRLASLKSWVLLGSLGLPALLGLYSSPYGHIDTTPFIYQVMPIISGINPALGLLGGIVFGIADMAEKMVTNNIYGVSGSGDYFGARMGYLIAYLAVIIAGVVPGVLARVFRNAARRIMAERAVRTADGGQFTGTSNSNIIELAASALGGAIGGAAANAAAIGLEMPAFYLRPNPDYSCYSAAVGNLTNGIPPSGVAGAVGGVIPPGLVQDDVPPQAPTAAQPSVKQPPAISPAGYFSNGKPYWGTGSKEDAFRDYPDAEHPPYMPSPDGKGPIWGTGTKEDPFRDYPDAKHPPYMPSPDGKGPIWGTGTKEDPFRDYPDAKHPPYMPSPDGKGPIWGTGTKEDPFRDSPPPVFDHTPTPPDRTPQTAAQPPVEPSVPKKPDKPPVKHIDLETKPLPPPVEPSLPKKPDKPPVKQIALETKPLQPPLRSPQPPVKPPVTNSEMPARAPKRLPTPDEKKNRLQQQDKILKSGETSWSEFLSAAWKGSKSDIGSLATDVKDAASWTADKTIEMENYAQQAVKDMWNEPQILQILWDTVKTTTQDIKDGAKWTANKTIEMEKYAQQAVKDMWNEPQILQILWDTAKTTTQDIKDTSATVAADIKDMLTNPERRNNLINSSLGISNFVDAMDPNLSPRMRVFNYAKGVKKLYSMGTNLVSCTVGGVLKQATVSIGRAKAIEIYDQKKNQYYEPNKQIINSLFNGNTVDYNTVKKIIDLQR